MTAEKTMVRDTIRVFNKHVLNPVMLLVAQRKHSYASVIDHVGRRSGRHYRTPVVADRVVDGFLIPLPYGDRVDWLQNLQAHGEGTIRHAGRTCTVRNPVVVDAAVAEAELPPRRRRQLHRFGVKSFVHVDVASGDGSGTDAASAEDGSGGEPSASS